MKYDLTVQVLINGQNCKVDHYQIWDRFGTKTLVEANTLTDACTFGTIPDTIATSNTAQK